MTHRIGLIGNDLGTSLSPALHEGEAAAGGLAPYSYEPIDLQDVANPDLGQVLAEAVESGFTGFNVTHPHKQAIMAALDEISEQAAAIGAVNTITLENGRLVGRNTDRSGFVAGLARFLPDDAARERVVLFGAGGAGSAVGAGLLDYGVGQLRIIDPDAGRRDQLHRLLQDLAPAGVQLEVGEPSQAADWIRTADGLVNATPLGMEGIGGTPFALGLLEARHWVADVVYRPAETELIATARALGCPVVPGTAMLVEQAADTFSVLTGTAPDRERMRAHLLRLLAPATSR